MRGELLDQITQKLGQTDQSTDIADLRQQLAEITQQLVAVNGKMNDSTDIADLRGELLDQITQKLGQAGQATADVETLREELNVINAQLVAVNGQMNDSTDIADLCGELLDQITQKLGQAGQATADVDVLRKELGRITQQLEKTAKSTDLEALRQQLGQADQSAVVEVLKDTVAQLESKVVLQGVNSKDVNAEFASINDRVERMSESHRDELEAIKAELNDALHS